MLSENSDSIEITSTSLIEDTLNISFEDINYTVRNGILSRGRKTLLDNVCGTFNAGELTVIMGQSGAGKSTLMDILAGYTKPTSGQILINGKVRDDELFRRRSCYIFQDDKVQDTLTVRESLCFAAELKLGDHISKQQKKLRVTEIIKSLKLDKSENTRAANLSGGQKKRLAIGLELVSDPPVMFLDEPTSGLDCSTSKEIVRLLFLLARQGRTVVITMHQPSAGLLQMVDRLYAVVAGKCAYMGSVPLLLPFLEINNLTCPPYHNPVDFLIEKSVENTDWLVASSQNGRNSQWITNFPNVNENQLIINSKVDTKDEVFFTILPPPKEDPANKILLKLKSSYSTSVWKQFYILMQRSLLAICRDRSFTIMLLGIHIAMALFIGCLYFNIGEACEHFRDNYYFLYFTLLFLMFTAFNVPEQIAVVRREHFNRWYTAVAYYFSTLVSTLPTQTVCTLTYTCIVYWMTGQPVEIVRFILFCTSLLIVSYVSLCFGLLNGSLFNVKNGVIFGPFLVTPYIVFSGCFLGFNDASYIFQWMFDLSFLKHGLVGLIISIYGIDRPKLKIIDADVIYCHFKNPRNFLKDQLNIINMDYTTYVITTAAMLGISLIVIILSYCMLQYRLKRKW